MVALREERQAGQPVRILSHPGFCSVIQWLFFTKFLCKGSLPKIYDCCIKHARDTPGIRNPFRWFIFLSFDGYLSVECKQNATADEVSVLSLGFHQS